MNANRLDRIVTRAGDEGWTSLADGSRVRKDDIRTVAIGEVDELNSNIGLLLTETVSKEVRELLSAIQNDLFALGGALALPGYPFPPEYLTRLDTAIEYFNAGLSPLKEFVLPGGCRAAAQCHVTRSVARRAERSVVTLAMSAEIAPECQPYLNRLSDLLFVLSRVMNLSAEQEEHMWQRVSSDSY